MPSIFPNRTRPAPPPASSETLAVARQEVRKLLESSDAFAQLPPDKRETLAKGMVQIASYLAEPDGVRLKRNQVSPQVRALAGDEDGGPLPMQDQPEFGQALRTGVEQAGALMNAVNFPSFVSGLIDGVFHSIVTSSIQQMEAYAKLVADVSKSLNQFRDENTTQNQGRDYLVETFPDLFELQLGGGDAFGDFGDFGGGAPAGPRVALRQDADTKTALARINQTLPLEQPLTRLDDEVVEALLVPAARTTIASGRQQLLATIVMLGINRIVVTDGKISAKVMYDFQARDNSRYRYSATQFDHEKDIYGNVQKTRSGEGSHESSTEQGSAVRDQNGNIVRGGPSYGFANGRFYGRGGGPAYEGGTSYSKGDYKYDEKPIIKMMSTSGLQNDSSLQARASLAGQVEVNFKSDYLPLEKMANPEAIAAIQMNAQPGMVRNLAARPLPNAAGAAPATGSGTAPAATTPAPAPAA
ncbi:hypothetical protein Psesu_0866 [Pseudoxanthomonas suwonensis 11-1]|uniref:Uncharacterized protein n=1 Tax=Pseudoxanthomonas suwonensis (strain 11-1) TaxID=743721 RepID=E6WRI7_PSEUU|nr:hypothetical protein [Pseudoxanthomonas suwonensis]ADV26718.1 hypothetical protein Psesu_0866 [Pseudoxanthomonas suwonensis 11-1]